MSRMTEDALPDSGELNWTDDEWALDQIRAHLFHSFEAVIEDNPEQVNDIVNGYLTGRLRLVFDRKGLIVERFRGYIAVPAVPVGSNNGPDAGSEDDSQQ